MGIPKTYEIQPVAIETSGVCGPDTLRFLNKVGRIDAERRHESRERRWLMERLSIAKLRGNTTVILSASPNSHGRQDMNSCFALDLCIGVLISPLIDANSSFVVLLRCSFRCSLLRCFARCFAHH